MLLLCSRSDAERAGEAAATLGASLGPRWKDRIAVAPVDGFGPDDAARHTLIVLYRCAASDASSWRDVIDVLDEAETPWFTWAENTGDAVNVSPAGAAWRDLSSVTPEEAARRLEAVLERQGVVHRLRSELAIAQRFQGGLKGEINRMHDEMQLAAMVQQELLPRSLPTVHGVSLGVMWRPANYVSGDIYDVIRLDEDHIGVFLADAVGHGVPAALLTMVIARALTTKEVTGNRYRLVPPGEALARLNQDMIRRKGDNTRFATAVYALIDCRSRTVRLAGAGHPAPLLLRAGQPMRELATPGGLLGVFEDEAFPEIELELHRDDRLLIYSDGFEVAFPDEQAESSERRLPTKRFIDEFARLIEHDTPTGMVSAMAERVNAQPGSLHQVDDLTLICLHAGDLAAPPTGGAAMRRAGGVPTLTR